MVGASGCARFVGQGCAHVLARHDAMGPNDYALWLVGGVYPESSPFLPAVKQPVLDPSHYVSQPGRLLAQSRHSDHALCLPAIFPGRKTTVDHRPGAVGSGAGRESEVLADGLCIVGGDTG